MIDRRTALALLAVPALARAQAYPDRPIRMIVPGPAAGAGDLVTRIVTERMQRPLGQPIAVENRPGAGTNIGMAMVARAAPDGYTLGLPSVASHAVNRWLYRTLPFDPVADFAPIGLMALVPNLMVVSPSLPVTNVSEFIVYARARPGELNYGSVGAGSSQHLAGVQFDMITGTRMTHVPYNQGGQMNTDLMEGRVQVLFQSVSAVAELARAGRVRALACTGAERLAAFPDVPTLREAGVDIVTTGWFGLAAPAGTPVPILDRLSAALSESLADADVQARLVRGGAVPRDLPRERFAAFMAEQTAAMQAVVRASGATVD
jgi:tripartite-type tricarboxylate transporter receptor subunit TctC